MEEDKESQLKGEKQNKTKQNLQQKQKETSLS
jgi:hypothetical protein